MAGIITLVGAGPGDPSLLTLRGARAVGGAQALFYDASVHPEMLSLATEGCERIGFGRRGSARGQSMRSLALELIRRCMAGQRIVVLLGGDPMMSIRGTELAAAFEQAAVEYEVIPGVPAGLGAASYGGVPLVSQHHAPMITFVSGRVPGGGGGGPHQTPASAVAFAPPPGAPGGTGTGEAGSGSDAFAVAPAPAQTGGKVTADVVAPTASRLPADPDTERPDSEGARPVSGVASPGTVAPAEPAPVRDALDPISESRRGKAVVVRMHRGGTGESSGELPAAASRPPATKTPPPPEPAPAKAAGAGLSQSSERFRVAASKFLDIVDDPPSATAGGAGGRRAQDPPSNPGDAPDVAAGRSVEVQLGRSGGGAVSYLNDPLAVRPEEIARLPGVVLLSVPAGSLGPMLAALIASGRYPDDQAAAVFNATRNLQQTVRARLRDLMDAVVARGLAGESCVLIMGSAASASAALRPWFEKRPLVGMRIALTDLPERLREQVRALEEEGAVVSPLPLLRVATLPEGLKALRTCLAQIGTYDWIVFSNPIVVMLLFETLGYSTDAAEMWGEKPRILSVLQATTSELLRCGLKPHLALDEFPSGDLGERIGVQRGMRVLLPRAMQARDMLPMEFQKHGAFVEVLPLYELLPDQEAREKLAQLIKDGELNLVVHTAASAIDDLWQLLGPQGRAELLGGALGHAAIGHHTARALRKIGIDPLFELHQPTAATLVEVVKASFTARRQGA